MRTLNRIFSFVLIILLCGVFPLQAARQPEFSTAGFYNLAETGRQAYSMNVAWRFHKGDIPDAYKLSFNDKAWETVSLPHGIEYLPPEASGCINYQGVVWYRKHFAPDEAIRGKKIFLHFEAIMGKCKIWVNGKFLKEHFGGYLPIVVDVSNVLRQGEDNVIAVCADNSDDPSYPPGKEENSLDFTYFGGIYRDCWLITHGNTYITDPNYEDIVAGGGVFTSFESVGEQLAVLSLKTHIRNEQKKSFSGILEYEFIGSDGERKTTHTQKIKITSGKSSSFTSKIKIEAPQLWTPEFPQLYQILVRIKDQKGMVVDGFRQKIGIRSIEFKGKDGFFLNGKPYDKPLLGGNRHQDFAVVGNALSNNINWRDAYKLKKAGFNILRLCHYPQDPSFMDACDELGLFVIVPTPGWQFWNSNSIFGQRVESDIRQMVRRDRNHPSLLFWEPILNETGLWGDSRTYDQHVQGRAADIVKEEYPYKYGYSGGGPENSFPILYGGTPRPDKVYFTREYGDGGSVNDWHGQNAPNRAARAWGEVPMLVQARSYERSVTDLYKSFSHSPQHMGGAVWHSFDTQRGYHPDPFYGGIMDIFRQPKYAYYMYMSQRDAQVDTARVDCGPMVYIAHEMTPFSPADVTVFSNCEEVRLTVYAEGKQYTHTQEKGKYVLPSPSIVFKDVYSYDEWKEISRSNRIDNVFMLAEGLIDGKVVATHKVCPSNRAEKIILTLDNENTKLLADGSDFVTVVASIADSKGNIKRLNNYHISFDVEGEGRILGDAFCFANPRPVVWGDAPILVQSTTRPGKIRIKAHVSFEGRRMPVEGELTFESYPAALPLVYDKDEAGQIKQRSYSRMQFNGRKSVPKDGEGLKEVYQQQNHFLQK